MAFAKLCSNAELYVNQIVISGWPVLYPQRSKAFRHRVLLEIYRRFHGRRRHLGFGATRQNLQ